MIRVDIEEVVDRPIADVFQRLSDIDRYRTWLPRSGIYVDSRVQYPDAAIGDGTVFYDDSTLGTLRGEITEFEPPRHIEFRQTLRKGHSKVFESRPGYLLEPTDGRTVVHHFGEAELYGFFRVLEPLIYLFAQAERRRVVSALKRSLEQTQD